MSENKLQLEKRSVSGKKVSALRAQEMIPSVVYGGESEPVLTMSGYNDTEKVLREAGYHSTIDIELNGKTEMAIVKAIDIDPTTRRIFNVEFQRVSADKAVEATTPIVVVKYEESEAAKLHYELSQVMESVEVKAKPADLPKEITADASGFSDLESKITVADLVLPKGVELADKELDPEQVVANVYDPAAEAAAREAEAEKEAPAPEDVPTTDEKKTDEGAEAATE